MSDINVTVQDEIVNIDVLDTPVLVNVVNSPGQQGPAGPGVPVGGTAGQILAKASATNYDTEWINNYAKYLATNVRNQTGSTINAFQVVYISGATGNKPLISLADADTEATSSKTYGVTATSIANNSTGDVVTAGELSGIDTSAFNEGDLLWLSTTAGGVVTSPPAEPAHAVFIGYVVRSHPTLGVIDVSIANGYELNELHGVQITTPTDNQGLFYNSTSTLWENKSITTALGYTPVPTTRNITINGVTYDLSADRTYTISTGISGSGTINYIPKFTSSSVLGDSNLIIDSTGDLGIGVSPFNGANATNSLEVGGYSLVVGNFCSVSKTSPGSYGAVGSNYYLDSSGQIRRKNGDWVSVMDMPTGGFAWRSAGVGAANTAITLTQIMGLSNSGNLLLGSFTDGGQRLQVSGDTLLRGSGATSATTALTVQNSSSTNLFSVRNDGAVAIGAASYNDGLRINRNPILANASSIFVNTAIQTTVNTIYRGIATSVGLFGSGFTLPNLSHFECINDGSFTAGVVTNLYGFRENLGTYVATNVYGFYGAIPAASGRWSLYMAGTADNYLAGRLGLGSTSLTNTIIRVGNNITGATSHFSVFASQTVLSDVANASIFTTEISTQATAFTLNTLRHYRATKGTFGAGSIVTNQYGFFAESTLTDATNNYGFWGDIAAGTGRWNLYMNGTADNYLAGNLLVGGTSVYGATITSYATSIRSGGIGIRNSAGTAAGFFGTYAAGSGSGSTDILAESAGFISISTGGSEKHKLFANGNVSIGTTSDLGVRFGVVGDTLLRGSGATSATTALTVQNSSSTNLFTVRNDGYILQKRDFNGTTDFEISNTSTLASAQSRLILTSASGTIIFGKNNSNYLAYKIVQPTDAYFYNYTAGDISLLNDFATGQIKFAAGGASTAHLTIKSNGRINMSSLPTSSTGLAAGDLWNDAGTVKIV